MPKRKELKVDWEYWTNIDPATGIWTTAEWDFDAIRPDSPPIDGSYYELIDGKWVKSYNSKHFEKYYEEDYE